MALKLKTRMATILGLLPLMYQLPRPAVGGEIDETTYDFSRYSKEIPSILRPLAAKMLNITEEEIMAMHPLDLAVKAKPRMQALPRWIRWKFDVPPMAVIEAWERKKAAQHQEPEQVKQVLDPVPKDGAGDDVKEEPAAFTSLHLWLPAVLLAAFLFHYYKPLRRRSRPKSSRLTYMGGRPCCSSGSTVVPEFLRPASLEFLQQEVESLVGNLAYVPGNVQVWRFNEGNGLT